MAAGYALNRFEGLNNEPDMEAPWAYHYAGRPDRTAEVVHAAVHNQFGLGRGGLPGNDDSGGLSSWYVWASLGLFPVAGQSLYLINAPSFARARLDLGDRELIIETAGLRRAEPGRAPAVRPVGHVQRRAAGRSWLRRPRAAPGRSLRSRSARSRRPGATTTGHRRCPSPARGYPEHVVRLPPLSRRDESDRMIGEPIPISDRARQPAPAGHRRPGRPGDLRSLR